MKNCMVTRNPEIMISPLKWAQYEFKKYINQCSFCRLYPRHDSWLIQPLIGPKSTNIHQARHWSTNWPRVCEFWVLIIVVINYYYLTINIIDNKQYNQYRQYIGNISNIISISIICINITLSISINKLKRKLSKGKYEKM